MCLAIAATKGDWNIDKVPVFQFYFQSGKAKEAAAFIMCLFYAVQRILVFYEPKWIKKPFLLLKYQTLIRQSYPSSRTRGLVSVIALGALYFWVVQLDDELEEEIKELKETE